MPYTEDQLLRTVTMRPYVDQSISFTLKTWDTYRRGENGRSMLAYKFTDQTGKVIFQGEDFSLSPMDAIDSDTSLRALLSFLTLRPGDTDSEYFESYTQEQLDFAEQHAEILSLYAMDESDNPQPFDETDQEDEFVHAANCANSLCDSAKCDCRN